MAGKGISGQLVSIYQEMQTAPPKCCLPQSA